MSLSILSRRGSWSGHSVTLSQMADQHIIRVTEAVGPLAVAIGARRVQLQMSRWTLKITREPYGSSLIGSSVMCASRSRNVR